MIFLLHKKISFTFTIFSNEPRCNAVVFSASSNIPPNSYFTADGVIISPIDISIDNGVTIVS